MAEENKLSTIDETAGTISAYEQPLGFEDAKAEDNIVPRIKVVNALSPERVDGIAEEGDVINSLSQLSVKGQHFIPIRVFYSNILWNPDRDDDANRIFCRSFDGKDGTTSDGSALKCDVCRKCYFDNTKTGKDAQPECTAYMNFLGFFRGDPMPVVVSFSKTNYNEGKKMLSIAKSLRASIWSYTFKFDTMLRTKGKQKWYILTAALGEATTTEERAIATEFYKAYLNRVVNTEAIDDAAAVRKDVIINPETEADL